MTTRPADVPHPDWLDETRYPFDRATLDTSHGRVHYVDEGTGTPVLMLHGNPTWSFLYRHVIEELAPDYRAVAPDYLGFGLSDAPEGFSYRPADHARVVEEVVDELGLEDVVLVVHDWGGPIGTWYATSHPENVRALVVANSFAWPLEDLGSKLFSRTLGSQAGKLLITRGNAFARFIMPLGTSTPLPKGVHRHYTEPLDTPQRRVGSWVFPRELVGSRTWLQRLWRRRDRIREKPALLAWGTDDSAFDADARGRWKRVFTDATTVKFAGANHFVQEDAGELFAEEVRRFLDERVED